MKLITNKYGYILQVKTKIKDKYYEFNKNGEYTGKYESKIIGRLKPLKRIGGNNG